jgi:hypothetical protein
MQTKQAPDTKIKAKLDIHARSIVSKMYSSRAPGRYQSPLQSSLVVNQTSSSRNYKNVSSSLIISKDSQNLKHINDKIRINKNDR